MALLGVNIDHIATLRQARLGDKPSPLFASFIAQQSGADQITVHLRKDQRHIQKNDVTLLKQEVYTKLNLEMSSDKKIVDFALYTKPDTATIVPENRKELTTEGGLKVSKNLIPIVKDLSSCGIEVSLFIEPDKKTCEMAKLIGATVIELHTGRYANSRSIEERKEELKKISKAAIFAKELGLKVAAGHGLDFFNINDIVCLSTIEEYNIGHSIISRAVFTGLADAVKLMKKMIQ